MFTIKSDYFYGNKVSDYGIENGYVDYATLAKSFEGVLNNNIMENTFEIGYWEQLSGWIDNQDEIDELQEQIDELDYELGQLEDLDVSNETKNKMENLQSQIDELQEQIYDLESDQENQTEIFQYFIVSDNGASILQECNEILFYNDVLDMYVWGVTHYGTSWSYVLTDIKIEKD